MRGCVAYDCFGAGQSVTQTGRVEVFLVVEQVHEIAWYLTEAADRGADVADLLAETERLAAGLPRPEEVDTLRARVVPALALFVTRRQLGSVRTRPSAEGTPARLRT